MVIVVELGGDDRHRAVASRNVDGRLERAVTRAEKNRNLVVIHVDLVVAVLMGNRYVQMVVEIDQPVAVVVVELADGE